MDKGEKMKIIGIGFGIVLAVALLIMVCSSVAQANHRDDPEACDVLPECIVNEHWCGEAISPGDRYETWKGVEYDKLAGCTIEEQVAPVVLLIKTDSDSVRDPRKKCRSRWFQSRGEDTYKCFGHEYERTDRFRWPQFEVKETF